MPLSPPLFPKIVGKGPKSNAAAGGVPSSCSPSRSSSLTRPSPPVMVIRATGNYNAQRACELSFQAGDFFHILDVSTDLDGCPWYYAHDPAKPARGLVPSDRFTKFVPQRTIRVFPVQNSNWVSTELAQFNSLIKEPLFEDDQIPRAQDASSRTWFSTYVPSMPSDIRCPALYGIVKHDFVAERPDELSAHAGEPVMIIAHSAQVWFVVKPIGQLGGPGLIPASYVEVRDMKTDNSLSEEVVLELIRLSAVPQVEVWKDNVAAYKANSITLKSEENEDDQNQIFFEKPSNLPHPRPAPCHQAECPSTPENNHTPTVRFQPFPTENHSVAQWQLKQHPVSTVARGLDTSLPTVEEEVEDGQATASQLRNRYGTLHRATVASFHYEQGEFWFEVRICFRRPDQEANLPLGLVLYRLYEHFEELDNVLRHEFRAEQGQLMKLSRSEDKVDELVCARRTEGLARYLEKLCQAPTHIRDCDSVFEFLSCREGDMELEADDMEVKTPAQVDVFACAPDASQPPTLNLPLDPTENLEVDLLLGSQRWQSYLSFPHLPADISFTEGPEPRADSPSHSDLGAASHLPSPSSVASHSTTSLWLSEATSSGKFSEATSVFPASEGTAERPKAVGG